MVHSCACLLLVFFHDFLCFLNFWCWFFLSLCCNKLCAENFFWS
jgi:hypothetical protein